MVLHQDKLDLYLTQLNSSSLSKYHTSFMEYGIFAWKMSQFHTKKYDSNFKASFHINIDSVLQE